MAPEEEEQFVRQAARTTRAAVRRLRDAKARQVAERKACSEAGKEVRLATDAGDVIRTAAVGLQQRVHDQIASVVTRCVRAVFGKDGPDEFRIVFEKRRGKTQARLVFVQGGQEADPQDGDAGGLLDVAAFALRLAALRLTSPRVRQLLVLDEPFKHLDRGRRPAAAELLLSLAEELGVQVVMVTHSDELRIGKVVEL